MDSSYGFILTNDDKIGAFPLLTEGEITGCIVARSTLEKLSKRDIDYLEQLTRQAAVTISRANNYSKILQYATLDALTSLNNRRQFEIRLKQEVAAAKRQKNPLCGMMIDIDFFKVVNDMYGYEWGDILLKNIANKLSAMIRKEDILTRYGDEEFLLILPNTSEDNAFLFAERFRREIEKMEFIPAGEEERHPITISGGISTYPCVEGAEEDANTIIRYAEHALYNAKKRGKNKIVQFSQINLGE